MIQIFTNPELNGLARTASDQVSPPQSVAVQLVLELYFIDYKYTYSLSPSNPRPTYRRGEIRRGQV